MELNLAKLKKMTMKVTLADGSIINVKSPTKGIYEEFKKATDEDLYEICAKVLSNNEENITFTVEKIEEMFDYRDALYVFKGYLKFLDEITNAKN